MRHRYVTLLSGTIFGGFVCDAVGRRARVGRGKIDLASRIVAILEPYVGQSAADTCVRATALTSGKMFDEVGYEDVPTLLRHVRRMLEPVVPSSTLDTIVERIQTVASE
jgi:hypothetical protein